MVAKISSNNSLIGTIRYNKLKLDEGKADVLFSQNMFEKDDGSFSLALCLKSFEPYLAANKRTENPIFHVSLNPDPKDNLNNEQLSGLAENYMQSMGYGNQPYIVFKHTDIDRTHLHVISCRVDDTGKKIDSNFENRRSMAICRQLEKEYNLHPAEKKERPDEIPLRKVDYKKGDVKHQVSNAVKALINNYHFQSFGEFRTLLEQLNVTAEEVRGMSTNNKIYNGIVYSATDDCSNRIGTPFKSSLFGKQTGYEALQRKYEKSAVAVKEKRIKEQLIPLIRAAAQAADSKEKLVQLLENEKILPIFRLNEQGRIYGVTFIDNNSRTVLNGSRLGKEFSANTLNEQFTPHSVQDNLENRIKHLEPNIHCQVSDLGLLSILDPEPNYSHDNQPIPKHIKKKRRRYRRQS